MLKVEMVSQSVFLLVCLCLEPRFPSPSLVLCDKKLTHRADRARLPVRLHGIEQEFENCTRRPDPAHLPFLLVKIYRNIAMLLVYLLPKTAFMLQQQN